MKISDMNYKQIEARKSQINSRLADEKLTLEDIQKLEVEVDSLNERKSNIKKQVETRNATIEKIVAGEGKVLEERQQGEENKMNKTYGIESTEYRNGFMKTLMGQDLTVEERAAFVHTTVNTAAVIPKELQNKIYSNMEEQHPILADINILRTGAVISIVKHTAIVQGDAKIVAEGVANDDEQNTFLEVVLAGKKFSKHIDITYELEAMAIPAFEAYLVQELGNRLGAAMADEVVRQVEADLAAGNKFAAVVPGTLALADVLKGMGLLKGASKVNVYTSSETLYGAIATLDAKHFSFLKDAQSSISGQLLGNGIKVEDSVEAGKVLILDPKQFTWNEVKGITFETDRDIKKGVRTIAAHALAGGTLTNDKAGAVITVGVAL